MVNVRLTVMQENRRNLTRVATVANGVCSLGSKFIFYFLLQLNSKHVTFWYQWQSDAIFRYCIVLYVGSTLCPDIYAFLSFP